MAVRYLVPATCFLLSGMLPGTIFAIGFDEVRQQSGLGEPLRLVIPIISNAADQISGDGLAGECFKVVPPTANDVPQLNFVRVTLERRGAQALVVLTTTYPIEEPIMRVAVQAGCSVQISREYTLFFDPVSIQPPAVQVAAASAPASQRVRPTDDAAAETQTANAAAAPTVLRRAARPTQRSSAKVQRSPSAPRAKPMIGTGTTSVNVGTGVVTQSPGAPKSSSAPRLQISRTIGEENATPTATTPRSVTDREALMALEEHAVVLQRQIAELSAQMEHLDAELRAAQGARAAAEKRAALAATERASEAASRKPSSWHRWLADNWPLLILVAALIALIAALATRRRGQRPLVPRPFTATQAASFNAADLGEPSAPNPEAEPDREGVVASIKDRPRGHMIPPAFVEPIEPDKTAKIQTDYEYDPGVSVADMTVEDVNFDDEVRKAYEAASEYSVLEREQPGIVARLVAGWGTQRTTAQLENILLAPRRSGKPLSSSAIEELKLLRSIAMERVADPDDTRTPPGTVVGPPRASKP